MSTPTDPTLLTAIDSLTVAASAIEDLEAIFQALRDRCKGDPTASRLITMALRIADQGASEALATRDDLKALRT